MFKIGQKVVWISDKVPNPICIIPKVNDIVVLKCPCDVFNNRWDIDGYALSLDGRRQSFHVRHFRPLDETFAEETIANLIEWNETQKVTV